MERENLAGDAKGKGTSGSNREVESTDAPERMISGANIGAVRPLRDFQSDGFAPEVLRCTRTSPAAGSGVGCSPTCSTSRAGPCFK